MPTWLRFTLFILVLGSLLLAVSFHVYRRFVGAFSPSSAVRRGLVAVLVVGVVGGFAARGLASSLPDVASLMGRLTGAVTLAAMISSVLLWPYELFRMGRWIWRSFRRWRDPEGEIQRSESQWDASASEDPAVTETGAVADRSGDAEAQGAAELLDRPPASDAGEVAVGRRHFVHQLGVGAALGVGASAGFYGTLFGRADFVTEEVELALPKLPPSLSGFTVVQLSDLHIGTFVGDAEFRVAEELVRRARPDLLVLTGDLLDSSARYAPQLGQLVRRLQPLARHGVVGILGNHDHMAGPAEVRAAMRGAGARVLDNQALRIQDTSGEGFHLLGVDDIWARRYGGGGPDLEAALKGTSDQEARVLLAHNPSFFEQAAAHVDLQLSGHTHGGQVTLFINPAKLVLKHGLVRGHYTRGGSQIYVNRGFGTAGPPARVGSAPEVTRLVLTPG